MGEVHLDQHVTIFQVGINNIWLLDILKIVKIQKLENIYQRSP